MQEKGANEPFPSPRSGGYLPCVHLPFWSSCPPWDLHHSLSGTPPTGDICCKARQFYWWCMFKLGIFCKYPTYYARREDARRSHLHCSEDKHCTIIHCRKGRRDQAGISIPKGMDCHKARVKQCTEILTLFSTQLGTRWIDFSSFQALSATKKKRHKYQNAGGDEQLSKKSPQLFLW